MRELIPFVFKYRQEKPVFRVEKKKVELPFKNELEAARYYAENLQNSRNEKTGRINFTGEYGSSAHTVSPYVKHFYENIEDGILPVVRAFTEKGYLTISSCQGHGTEIRFVVLAFQSEEARGYVSDLIMSVGLPYLKTHHLAKLINNDLSHNESGTVTDLEKSTADEFTPENNTTFVNAVFYRRYEAVCFLRIEIGHPAKIMKTETLWESVQLYAERAWIWFTNQTFVRLSTSRLAKIISSDVFPRYLA
jgi:hypothetical protein